MMNLLERLRLIRPTIPTPEKSFSVREMERTLARMQQDPSDCSLFSTLTTTMATHAYLPDTSKDEVYEYHRRLLAIHKPQCTGQHILLVMDYSTETDKLFVNDLPENPEGRPLACVVCYRQTS